MASEVLTRPSTGPISESVTDSGDWLDEPHTVTQLWLMAHPRRNRVIDVTDTFPQKLAALRRHRSQVGDGEWLEERIGEFLARLAEEAVMAGSRLI